MTMFFNVPLNNALIAADGTNAADQWSRYETVWTAWNHVRAITSLASCALIILGLR
ncbi:MAG: anthrone oxygenase family protein [Acidobacteriota bacterium]